MLAGLAVAFSFRGGLFNIGAAGQLIVREAGGVVSFPAHDDPLGAPLDAAPTSHVVAARSESTLRELERIPS